jgi:uncharacterized protein involved in response to NO
MNTNFASLATEPARDELVVQRWTPFAYGFRPFFLAALLYAPLAVLAWLWLRASGRLPLPELPPQLWHGHEMIFGFVGAAIAGFLLTAVPSWTGERGFAGKPLVLLTILWVAGRLAFACAAWIPLPALMAVELSFFPALAVLLAPPLLRARNRNTPLLFVIVVLWSMDAIFLYAALRADVPLAMTALRASIDVVLLLITVIGGRIVPAFTGNALRRRGIEAQVRSVLSLEITVIAAMALAVVIDIVAPFHPIAAAVAAIAACAHALRLVGWQGMRTLKEPIVWVLHLAYAWLPLGLALKALHLSGGVPWAMQWLHALTMGAIAMMVVAVVTRASLGHTGRALVVSRPTAVAYALLAAAALLRAFGPYASTDYEWTLRVSGALWIAGFALILIVYAPILLRPRIDGRPG